MRRILALFVVLATTFAAAGCAAGSQAATNLPTVTGAFDKKPTLHYPSIKPSTTLQKEVLRMGTGKVVRSGNLVIAQYYGQIWKGKVFGSSFGSSPIAFAVGVGLVLKAWDQTLVGTRVGSRVLMVVPPADGYGTKGNSTAGIMGTDTIAFVVDVLGAYDKAAIGDKTATLRTRSSGSVTVAGTNGSKPTITIAKSAPQPKKQTTTLIYQGHGAPVVAGLVVAQVLVNNWSGTVADSSWNTGVPAGISVAAASKGNPLSSLIGQPLGSRVLVIIPKDSQGGPYAAVIDLVAQPYRTPMSAK